jgi:hypothetical protein
VERASYNVVAVDLTHDTFLFSIHSSFATKTTHSRKMYVQIIVAILTALSLAMPADRQMMNEQQSPSALAVASINELYPLAYFNRPRIIRD